MYSSLPFPLFRLSESLLGWRGIQGMSTTSVSWHLCLSFLICDLGLVWESVCTLDSWIHGRVGAMWRWLPVLEWEWKESLGLFAGAPFLQGWRILRNSVLPVSGSHSSPGEWSYCDRLLWRWNDIKTVTCLQQNVKCWTKLNKLLLFF